MVSHHQLALEIAPYLTGVYLVPERVADFTVYPFNLPFVRRLDLNFTNPMTFFVGENGSGKSTLLEAIANLAGFHTAGGGKEDLIQNQTNASALAAVLRPKFRAKLRGGFFFRAETLFDFANLLDDRRHDPDFHGDPYQRYGGSSLHTRSHGEAFLAVLQNRLTQGLFLFDEPEAALSPERQLHLLALLADMVANGKTQCIIATHSPILMTFPGATLINFDTPNLKPIALSDTKHYQVTRRMIEAPNSFWKHLVRS